MTDRPVISVVTGAYNSGEGLRPALESILYQQGVELELIVVNDGSTDDSLKILQEYADKDNRLKVIDQKNHGLTRSLIRGCAEAKGEYIARQDAGDISLSGRLEKESEILNVNPDVVMVSCGTRFTGPEGEVLYEVLQSEKLAAEGLHQDSLESIKGPSHHGSTMFRKEDYLAVGGYREQFEVAQDLDLWTRLAERGRHLAIQDILYQASVVCNAISSRKRNRQIQTTKLILECSRRRHNGEDEEVLLERAARLSNLPVDAKPKRAREAEYFYFVGSCLRNSDVKKARRYFRRALRSNPFHIRALLRILNSR